MQGRHIWLERRWDCSCTFGKAQIYKCCKSQGYKFCRSLRWSAVHMHSCAYIHALLSAYTSISRHSPSLKGTRHRGAIRVENLLSSSSIPNTTMCCQVSTRLTITSCYSLVFPTQSTRQCKQLLFNYMMRSPLTRSSHLPSAVVQHVLDKQVPTLGQ
jgi:hypothetical protein